MNLYEIVIAFGVVGMCIIVVSPLLMKKPCMSDDVMCACPDCTRLWGTVAKRPIGMK